MFNYRRAWVLRKANVHTYLLLRGTRLCYPIGLNIKCIKTHLNCKMYIMMQAIVNYQPSPWQGIFHNTSWRGGRCDPPGVSKVSVVALRKKDQSFVLDEYSRLVV